MRILTITPSLGLGGTERAAQNFSIGYRRHGHEVTVLNHGRAGPREASLSAAGCRVFNFGDDRQAVLDILGSREFDVVHIHREGRRNDRETDLLRWARPKARLIAETNVFFARDYGVGDNLIDIHLQLACINHVRWRRRGGKGASVVIPNPVDAGDYPTPATDDIQTFKATHRIPADHFVFGRVGQPLVGKWDPCIVEAFVTVVTHHPRVHLLLVGASPDVVERILQLNPGLRAHVTLLGTLTEPAELGVAYGAMDSFLHAARQGESFGYVLAEALLYGLPVITVSRPHRDNAQTEVIRHGIDGYVVRSRRYLVEAMESLMQDHALRSRVRQGGRQGVIERFDLERVCSDALCVFEALLGGSPTPLLRESGPGIPAPIIEGIGRDSPIELMLARIYDWPWVDYCREQLRYLKRGSLARLRHP
ncbi:glycosyltransferase family 4 protein [Methyloparacoccus murrellii]